MNIHYSKPSQIESSKEEDDNNNKEKKTRE